METQKVVVKSDDALKRRPQFDIGGGQFCCGNTTMICDAYDVL